MANEYYTASNAPATSSSLSSATIRSEFSAIEVIGDKLPVMTAHGDEVVMVNSGATALTTKTKGVIVGEALNAATDKATPVDADLVPLADSAASFTLKKLTWANLKATIKTYYDSVTATLTGKTINLTSNTLSGTKAQFDAALSDDNFGYVGTANTWTLAQTFGNNLSFTGTGNRITGDFSNATVANRVMFQTSTTNGNSSLDVIPNGTSTQTDLELFNAADTTNSGILRVRLGPTQAQIRADAVGTGTYLPMTFYTGGAERMRIDDMGRVGIGVSPSIASMKLTVLGGGLQFSPGTTANEGVRIQRETGHVSFTGINNDNNAYNGFKFYTSATASLQLDGTGNVVAINPSGALGYGAGAGGTVTQATSKATAVTLNKPCGRITTTSDALAAGAIVTFIFNNSILGVYDVLCLSQVANTAGNYQVWTNSISAGAIYIHIKNNDSISRSEALAINFAIIKGSAS